MAEEGGESITIRVKDAGGEEMFFKVKKTTKMEKIISAYSQRKGMAVTAFRLMFDGNRVNPTDTPKMLEMDDNDQMDAMLETVGGNCFE